jgi:glycosyltransferase involved in cell wall biosynthesis
VGAERAHSWAKHLKKYGFHPIIVTRNWDEGQTDLNLPATNVLQVTKTDDSETHRVPLRKGLAPLVSSIPLMRKGITLINLFLHQSQPKLFPFGTFRKYSQELIEKDPEIVGWIVSGQPFGVFHIGHSLKKQFPEKLWIADYRDEWSTHPVRSNPSGIWKYIYRQEKKNEKRWTNNIDFFTTVAPILKENIQAFTDKPGEIVMNGYTQAKNLPEPSSNKVLKIIYAGTLYPYQPMEEAVQTFLEAHKRGVKLHVSFVGTELMPDTHEQLLQWTNGHEIFSLIPKVSREELEKLYSEHHLLFLTSYNENKGWYPVKLFDYASVNRPILHYPSDEDTIAQFIDETNSGYAYSNREKCIIQLERIYSEMVETGQAPTTQRNISAIQKYSREKQAEQLAIFVDQYNKVRASEI